MSRRLPSSLTHQLKSCKLFSSGQRCATCPLKNQNTCPLPDIEECLLPRQLAQQRSRLQGGCGVQLNEDSRPINVKPAATEASAASRNRETFARPQPITPGCMRILNSFPSPSVKAMNARGMKIATPQKAPEMAVLGAPAEEPLVSADPFEVFRALRRAHATRKAVPVALSSSTGKALFQQALVEGSMENYFDLAQNHETEGKDVRSNSLSCMAMVFNALGHDPQQKWKGLWRWNTAEVLQGAGIPGAESKMDVVDFVAAARCNGAKAAAFPCDGSEIDGLDSFRKAVRTVCEDENASSHIVVHFDRSMLGMTGGAHFSPVGGFNAEEDMVLVLDVARKSSPPYWIALRDLYRAMTGKGFATVASGMLDEAQGDKGMCPALLCSWAAGPLSTGDLAWQRATRTALHGVRRSRQRIEASGASSQRQSGLGRGVEALLLASMATKAGSLRMTGEYGRN